MKQSKRFHSFMRLKADLAPMSWSERIEHIWINYKETILIAVMIFVVAGSMLTNYLTNRKEILMGGIVVNVPLSEEGLSYIESEFFDTLGADSRGEEVSVLSTTITGLGDEANSERNYYIVTQTIAMMTNEEVDYLILDKTALEIYLAQDAFLDLRDVFDEEELAAFEDKLIKLTTVNEAGETIDTAFPVAIDISALPFIQGCADTEGSVYIGFVANAPNQERLYDFWTYLTVWQSVED